MAYRVDLSQTAAEVMLHRLSYVYGVELTSKDIVFHPNGAQQFDRETAEKRGVESYLRFDWIGNYEGKRKLEFTQADVRDLLGSDCMIRVPPKGPRRTDRLAHYIYEQLGINIDRHDIFVEYIPADVEEFTLKIYKRHLALKGEIKVVYSDRRLEDLWPTTVLQGFNKESQL